MFTKTRRSNKRGFVIENVLYNKSELIHIIIPILLQDNYILTKPLNINPTFTIHKIKSSEEDKYYAFRNISTNKQQFIKKTIIYNLVSHWIHKARDEDILEIFKIINSNKILSLL